MAASSQDLLMEVGIATATTLDANYTINDTSITVASTSGWPTATGVAFAIDVVDSAGAQVAGTYNEYVGVVSSATSITSVSHQNGTDRNYSAGATTRVYIPVSAERENRIVEWGTTQHKQSGAHGAVTADSLATNTISEGTAASGVTIDSVLLKDGKVATAGAVENTAVMVGMPVQMVSVGYSASATGTTIIPNDDTIPQNTEGDEYMSLAVTPKSATNILVIEVNAFLSSADATQVMTAALFQDSTASALAASASFTDASTYVPKPVSFTYRMVAGTTSATTFKVRAGSHQASTTTFNGVAGNRIFGAIPKSSIVITEYKAS